MLAHDWVEEKSLAEVRDTLALRLYLLADVLEELARLVRAGEQSSGH